MNKVTKDQNINKSILEYIDPEEQNVAMIAMRPQNLNYMDKYNYK